MAQLGTILSEFPENVVLYVTSPQTGLQRRSKWPPTVSEVLIACEEHQNYLRKVAETRKVAPALRGPSTLGRPGSIANVFVPPSHPRYERAVKWAALSEPRLWRYGKSSDGRDGIWVDQNAYHENFPMKAAV